MMRACLAVIAALLVPVPVSAQQDPRIEVPAEMAQPDAPVPWTGDGPLDAEERFTFAIVGDRTGGERSGVFPQGLEKINLVQPAFVMSVGDFVSGWKGDIDSLNDQWDRFLSEVEIVDAPFFFVPGNHDVQNAESEAVWNERFGPTFYHFRYKDTLFVTLNSEFIAYPEVDPEDLADDPKGKAKWRASEHVAEMREAMLADLEAVLAANADVRWTFVFMHQALWRGDWAWPPKDRDTGKRDFSDYPFEGPWPRWNHDDNPHWQRVLRALEGRDYSLFAGHNHDYAYVDAGDGENRRDHVVLATTGGSTKLRGLDYGEFDHFMLVTMTEEGPVFGNLLLDGVQPLDIPIPRNRPPFVD